MFSTWAERHAFITGIFESLCLRPSKLALFAKSRDEIGGEYHYYAAGRALGLVVLLFIFIGVAKLAQGALL
jgi:hypothetical protein